MKEVTLYAFKTGNGISRKVRMWRNPHNLNINVGDKAYLKNRNEVIEEECRYKIICDKDATTNFAGHKYEEIKPILKKSTMLVPIEEIEIDKTWQTPNKAKFEAKLKHYNETQQFIDNIILIKGKDKKYKLVDGYTTYLICANTLKQSEVKVDYFE